VDAAKKVGIDHLVFRYIINGTDKKKEKRKEKNINTAIN
jgi:hypothetical protein